MCFLRFDTINGVPMYINQCRCPDVRTLRASFISESACAGRCRTIAWTMANGASVPKTSFHSIPRDACHSPNSFLSMRYLHVCLICAHMYSVSCRHVFVSFTVCNFCPLPCLMFFVVFVSSDGQVWSRNPGGGMSVLDHSCYTERIWTSFRQRTKLEFLFQSHVS
jgi:hypothetical protein